MTVQPTRTHAPRHAALAALLAVLLLAVTSCSNTAEVGAQEEPESALESSAEPSDTTTPSTSSITETTPTEPEATEEALLELWTAATKAADLPAAELSATLDQLPGTFSEQSRTSLTALLPEGDPRELIHAAPSLSRADDSIIIDDCVIYELPANLGSSVLINAAASPNPDGTWQIDEINQVSHNCLPASVNNDIITAYNNYWEARKRYFNPPDPDHPDIDKVFTAEYAEAVRTRLVELQAEDWNLYEGITESHPEVTRVSGPDHVQVTDCRDVDPESGVFHSNGELVAESSPNPPESRDLFVVDLVRENGIWLVDGVPEAQHEADCQFAPTRTATTIVESGNS